MPAPLEISDHDDPHMRRLVLVTCRELPVADADQAIIDQGLDDLGERHRVRWVAWDASAVWQHFGLAWIRTPWDYAQRHGEFLAWLDAVEDQVTVVNPVPVLRWNSHKSYLLDLEHAGVAIVPTVMLDRTMPEDLEGVLELQGWGEAVVKPAVSVGAIGASRVSVGAAANVVALAEAARDGDVLVQPYMAGVADGEVSIVLIEGRVSHAVRKVPATGDFRVHTEYGGSVIAHEPTPAELALAEAAVAAVPTDETLLYARVDCVTDDDGQPRLMELELIEPALFLPYAPDGHVERLLRAVIARLDAD